MRACQVTAAWWLVLAAATRSHSGPAQHASPRPQPPTACTELFGGSSRRRHLKAPAARARELGGVVNCGDTHPARDAEGAFRASALRLRGGASAGVCKESEGLGPFGGDCRPNTSGGSGGSSKGKAIEVTSPPCARTYTRVALAACLCGYPSLTIRPSRMQSCAVSRCLRVRASTDLCACRCGKTGGSTSRVVLASTTGSARCVPDYVCGHAMPAEHTHRESESVR